MGDVPLPEPTPGCWWDKEAIAAMHTHAAAVSAADNAALRAETADQQKVIAAYEMCNPPWAQELRERVKVLEDALREYIASADDTIICADKNINAAMLRFCNADKAARAALEATK